MVTYKLRMPFDAEDKALYKNLYGGNPIEPMWAIIGRIVETPSAAPEPAEAHTEGEVIQVPETPATWRIMVMTMPL